MIHCSCLLLLLTSVIINLVYASYVTHPNINFDPLQQLVISGSYSGISLYKDTKQLTTIAPLTSSIISLSNDTLKLLASSNINGTIYDACLYNTNTLFLAGNFTSINEKTMNNIISIDITNNDIKPLKNGLDGPVHSVYCDTDAVYVGGSFIAPSSTKDTTEYSNSLSKFGGSVAIWKNNEWLGLPWKGLNGPVNSILKNKKNQIIFAGKFDTTTDGQLLHAPASQPISIPTSGVTATSGENPASILCASATSSNSSWLLAEGTTGTWQTNFINYQVNPSLIRIVNSKVENHQTKEFSIRSLTAGSANYILSFVDPVTGIAKICSNNCTLSNDASVTYQDFRVLNTSMTSGIAIDIKSWYGVGGGLSSVKVFQSEIFSYAVNPDPTNPCLDNSNSLPKVVQSGGNWTVSSDKTSPYLSYKLKPKSDTASVTFYPNIAEAGIYELLVYTPPCETSGCSDRTDIDITIQTSTSTKANVTMSQKYPGSITAYTGYFDLTSSFDPSIKFNVAKNATVTSSSTLVAFAIQLVQAPTSYALSSILQYNTTQTNITMTNLAWGPLPDNVPYGSVINSMKLVDNGDLYIGGNFSGTDKSNAKYTNIVQFDSSANQMKALNGGGLNSVVQSIDATSTEIFVGGNFTAVSTLATAKPLNYVARYDIKSSTWNPLNGGVNGPVTSINVLSPNSVLVSGLFNLLVKSETDTYSTKSSGNAWWNSQTGKWIVDNSVPFLSGTVHSAFVHGDTNYFVGNLKSAQRYQSNGISYLSSGDDLNFPAFYPDGSQPAIAVSSGVLFNSHSGVSTSTSANSTSTTAVFGGAFNLPNNIQNIAIFANNTWSGVQGADWQGGQISTMAVNNDLLYVGGRFTGSTSNNLAVFSLSNKSLSLNPNIKTNDGSPANVNIIRHVPTQNAMIVGGNFSSVGSLSCSSICAFNTASLQWNNLGSGLIGEVYDMTVIDNKLVASGNLTLNDSPLLIAQFDFDKNSWGPFGTAELPGPSRAISYDNITQHLYVSGETKDKSTTYLRIWNGKQFDAPSTELGPGSVISRLSMLPLKNTTSQNILLASGFINLGPLGNVSAAFYDGQDWIPYLVTSNANGDATTSLSSLFFLDQPYITAVIKKYLSTPIVILVAIAISLGIVFLIVLGAMLIIHFKRKHDSKVNPQSNPAAYYGKPPRTPQSLLTMLKDPNDDKSDDNKYSMEKSRHLEEPETHLYNMSKSISTDHLHEQQLTPFNSSTAMTTARAAPLPPTTHSRSVPQTNIFNNVAPAAAAAATLESSRPDSYVRPVSEYQRDNDSFYNYNTNNNSGREMTEIPGRQNSYNPFRNSDVGVAVGGGTAIAAAATAAAAGNAFSKNNETASPVNSYSNNGYAESQQRQHELTNNYYNNTNNANYGNQQVANNNNNNNAFASTHKPTNASNAFDNSNPYPSQVQQGQAVSYGNIAPASASTAKILPAAALGGAAVGAALAYNKDRSVSPNTQRGENATYHGNVSPQQPIERSGTVQWTTSPSEPASYAVVKPISLVGNSDESSLVDPISGPQATRAAMAKTNNSGERVIWTHTPTSEDAMSQAHIVSAPSITVSSSNGSKYSPQPETYPNNTSLSSHNNVSESNVRWTKYDDSNAVGVAQVEPTLRESGYHDHGSFYSPTPLNIGSTSNHSLNDIVGTNTEGLSSDPDIVRWTTAPASNKSTVKVEPVFHTDDCNSPTNNKNQYQASLAPVAWPHENEYQNKDRLSPHAAETHIDAEIAAAGRSSGKDEINTKVMHKNAFRLSDAGSLPSIDTNMFSSNANQNPEDLMSPDSAVRWRNANVASPIETAFAPQFLEPASATVTRRYDDNEGDAFESYYNTKPQTTTTGIVPNPSKTTPSSSKDKYKPVANTAAKQNKKAEQFVEEPIERKTETVDEAIFNRDLDALSMIIQEEEAPISPQQQQTAVTPVPTNSRSTPSPAAGPGAMDGRAASKRMVEEYFSSRNNKAEEGKDKKSKYKSDFKSVMESAILNNTQNSIATEDKPHLYYAKFDFSAREHGELGFGKADPIIVVDSSDDIWWMGYKADKSDGSYIQGVFPSNYVEIATEIRN